MKSTCVSIAPLLTLSVLVAMSPLSAQAIPADSDDIAHMKAGLTTVEGVVTQMKSGLYTVRTTTGTNYTLAESSAVRYGQDVPKIGDEMVLWINEGNDILDAKKKRANNLSTRFMSGKLVSINYGRSQITLSMADREESFRLRPESRTFNELAVGTPMTIAVNKEEEVIAIRVDKDSEVPRTGLSYSDHKSALKRYRHLGMPE